jgi:hypothetical protein
MAKYFCKACDTVFDMDDDWDYSCGICGYDYCSSECFNSDAHDDIDDDVLDREEDSDWGNRES